MTDMDIYSDFTESDQAGIPGTMYRFLDLVNVSPEFQYYKRQMRPLLRLQPGEVVLDVGCGVGYESCRLAHEHPQVQIIGVDRETMVAEAARRAARLGVDVRWLSGAAEALPMPETSPNGCCCSCPTQPRASRRWCRLPEARTTVWLDELVAANAAELFTVALVGWLCSGGLPG